MAPPLTKIADIQLQLDSFVDLKGMKG